MKTFQQRRLSKGLVNDHETKTISSGCETGFLDRTVSLGHRSFHYQVYVPRNYRADQLWPLILFLHGSCERGDDGLKQTHVGLGAAIRQNAVRFQTVAVFPQAPIGQSWQTTKMIDLALATMRRTMREFRIDPMRLYLTGVSMGGTGVWTIAARYPGLFAALVPICGALHFPAAEGGRPDSSENRILCSERASQIGRLPVWVFHGENDPIVPVAYSRQMVASLETSGCPVRYTEYRKGDHNVWDQAYDNAKLIRWLFRQSRVKHTKKGPCHKTPHHPATYF